MLGWFFGASKREPVAPVNHHRLGNVSWDAQSKHWRAEIDYGGRRVPLYVPGKPPTDVSEQAVEKLLPVLQAPAPTLETAIAYLAAGLSSQAPRTVARAELLVEEVIVYAETEEGFHVCFQWREQPDWILRVFFKDGIPASWAFDD